MTTPPPYAEMFRGLPACPCQIEWIPAFERHLNLAIPGFRGTLAIAQLIGYFGGSGSTHGDPNGIGLRKGGGVSDFWLTGHMADLVVAEARQMGADPTWHRPAGWDGPGSDEHVHCGLRGCPHRTVQALGQEWDVDHDLDGLADHAPDPGPRPPSGRTWQEGIAWALQQEDDMPSPKDWTPDDWAAFDEHVWGSKPQGSKLTRDELLKQAEKASAEARDLLKNANGAAGQVRRRAGG